MKPKHVGSFATHSVPKVPKKTLELERKNTKRLVVVGIKTTPPVKNYTFNQSIKH